MGFPDEIAIFGRSKSPSDGSPGWGTHGSAAKCHAFHSIGGEKPQRSTAGMAAGAVAAAGVLGAKKT